jgi:hypothetical protein
MKTFEEFRIWAEETMALEAVNEPRWIWTMERGDRSLRVGCPQDMLEPHLSDDKNAGFFLTIAVMGFISMGERKDFAPFRKQMKPMFAAIGLDDQDIQDVFVWGADFARKHFIEILSNAGRTPQQIRNIQLAVKTISDEMRMSVPSTKDVDAVADILFPALQKVVKNS